MKREPLIIRPPLSTVSVLVLAACIGINVPATLAAQTPNPQDAPSMITLTPYLLLDGTCKPAMEFYQSCLGGELTVTLVGDSPMKAAFPPNMHHKVVNARLVSGSITISASDWLRPDQTPVQGNTVCLYVSGASSEELKVIFEKLSSGANVTDPLRQMPFGTYGALNDKFGVRWMFQAGPAQ